MTHRDAKGHIRDFMRAHYTDERLAQLLAHAQEGKLTFTSCCCFIGIVTADHALSATIIGAADCHYDKALLLPGAVIAESAFRALWESIGCKAEAELGWHNGRDAARRRILIPMVRAEMRRRDRRAIAERAAAVPSSDFAAALVSAHMVAK